MSCAKSCHATKSICLQNGAESVPQPPNIKLMIKHCDPERLINNANIDQLTEGNLPVLIYANQFIVGGIDTVYEQPNDQTDFVVEFFQKGQYLCPSIQVGIDPRSFKGKILVCGKRWIKTAPAPRQYETWLVRVDGEKDRLVFLRPVMKLMGFQEIRAAVDQEKRRQFKKEWDEREQRLKQYAQQIALVLDDRLSSAEIGQKLGLSQWDIYEALEFLPRQVTCTICGKRSTITEQEWRSEWKKKGFRCYDHYDSVLAESFHFGKCPVCGNNASKTKQINHFVGGCKDCDLEVGYQTYDTEYIEDDESVEPILGYRVLYIKQKKEIIYQNPDR